MNVDIKVVVRALWKTQSKVKWKSPCWWHMKNSFPQARHTLLCSFMGISLYFFSGLVWFSLQSQRLINIKMILFINGISECLGPSAETRKWYFLCWKLELCRYSFAATVLSFLSIFVRATRCKYDILAKWVCKQMLCNGCRTEFWKLQRIVISQTLFFLIRRICIQLEEWGE